MKILITGHKAFIGSNLYDYLKEDHEIVGIDLTTFQEKSWWEDKKKYALVRDPNIPVKRMGTVKVVTGD